MDDGMSISLHLTPLTPLVSTLTLQDMFERVGL